jgi:hypothetical protein
LSEEVPQGHRQKITSALRGAKLVLGYSNSVTFQYGVNEYFDPKNNKIRSGKEIKKNGITFEDVHLWNPYNNDHPDLDDYHQRFQKYNARKKRNAKTLSIKHNEKYENNPELRKKDNERGSAKTMEITNRLISSGMAICATLAENPDMAS